MAGAVCTMTYLPWCMAWSTLSISRFSDNAPVGQTSMHWPHCMQGTEANDRFSAGPTIVLKPRFSNPRMPMPWASLHLSMQRPQRMHLLVSLTKPGATSS